MFSRLFQLVLVLSFVGDLFSTEFILAQAEQKVRTHQNKPKLEQADQIAKKTSRLRGLVLKQTLKRGVMSKAQIRTRIMKRMSEEYTPAELEGETLALKRFGLIPESMGYVKTMVELLEEQIAGFYDPKEKKLYIAEWMPRNDMVMSHEIVHALQDQHFELGRFLKDVRGDRDASAARQALVEGDSTALMLEYQMASLGLAPAWGNRFMMRTIQQGIAKGIGRKGLPLVIQEGLVFPYLAGLEFVVHFRRSQAWTKIDAIFRKPPLSTEHILHPDKYELYEKPHQVPLEKAPILSEYNEKVSSVLGEKGIAVFLRTHGLSEHRAVQTAEGWGGDRYAVYVKKNHKKDTLKHSLGVALFSWDEESDALEFMEALEHVLPNWAQKHGKEGNDTTKGLIGSKDSISVFLGDGTYLTAERQGTKVILLSGVPSSKVKTLLREVWLGWLSSPEIVQ